MTTVASAVLFRSESKGSGFQANERPYKKTWFIMTIPYLQRSLFESPKPQRSLLNLFNLA